MKTALVSKISSEQLEQLRSGYPQIEWIEAWADRNLLAALGAEVTIVYGNVRPFEFKKLSGLKWIHATWTGVENLMKLPLAGTDLIITKTHGHVTRAITEHVVGSVYYLARDLGKFYEASMNGEWCKGVSVQYVRNSHALVLGLGDLGQSICSALKDNGVNVSGVNSKGTPVDFCDNVYSSESCGSILNTVDHVICCLPATPATDKIINAVFMERCKDGVTVINVGRGNAVDQEALLAAVNSGKVKGAVLDTTTPEPLNDDSSLYRHPRILITAHRSWMPSDFGTVAYDAFLRNLDPYLKNEFENMPGRVNPEKGY